MRVFYFRKELAREQKRPPLPLSGGGQDIKFRIILRYMQIKRYEALEWLANSFTVEEFA